MNERLLNLAQRISDELDELERIIKRAQEGWHRAQQLSDDLYLDGVALNLHSFYDSTPCLYISVRCCENATFGGGIANCVCAGAFGSVGLC